MTKAEILQTQSNIIKQETAEHTINSVKPKKNKGHNTPHYKLTENLKQTKRNSTRRRLVYPRRPQAKTIHNLGIFSLVQ